MFEKHYEQIAEKASRPEVKDLKRSSVEILLHVVAAALLIVSWCSTIYRYQKETSGEMGILFSTIATMVYFFMMIPELIPPREYNYLVKITEENAREQYRMARIFLGSFRVGLVAAFLPATLAGEPFEITAVLVIVFIPAIIACYIYRATRAR